MNKRIRSQLNNNSGFTLVELIVVLILMMIVLSVTVSAGLGWQDWARFNHEEDVAEEIFYAAQNQITELDSTEAFDRKILAELRRTNLAGNDYGAAIILAKDKLETIKYKKEGNNEVTYSWDSIWASCPNLNVQPVKIIRLHANRGDYKNYVSGDLLTPPTSLSDAEKEAYIKEKIGTKILFDIVSSYMSDTGALNGAITLEFSPDAAQVFSVCYSDSVDYFAYGDETTSFPSGKKVFNVTNRIIQNRRANMVGYFSVDELAQKNRGRSQRENYLRLEMENSNLLVMKIVDTEYGDTEKEVGNNDALLFDIYDSASKKKAMTFSINYRDIPDGTNDYASSLKDACDNPTKIKFSMRMGEYKGKKDVEFRVPVWKYNDKIYFILDAADVQAQTLPYSKSYAFNKNGKATVEFDSNDEKAFRNTYSFYRFGLAEYVNHIYADVRVQNILNYATSARSESGRIKKDDDSTFKLHTIYYFVVVVQPNQVCSLVS